MPNLFLSLLEKISESFPHHESLDSNLKQLSKVKELMSFTKESSELSRENRTGSSSEWTVDTQISHIIPSAGKRFANNLIAEMSNPY